MPLYHKLVRDQIPTIIARNGKKATFRTLNEEEFLVEAKRKLHQEIAEYDEATETKEAVEELADLLELIHAWLGSMEQHRNNLKQSGLRNTISGAALMTSCT